MKRVPAVSLAVLGSLVVAVGCGKEPPPPPPPPPGTQPTALPLVLEDKIQVAARIEPGTVAEGFPQTLAVILSLDPADDLYWNNEGKPVALTFEAPEGVRLSQAQTIIPNTLVDKDTRPRMVRIGLDEGATAAPDWALTVRLEAFVCELQSGVCLRQRERHVVRPTRAE